MSNQFIKSKPNFNRFLKAVTREGTPDRVPFFEIFSQLDRQVLDYIKEQDTSFGWICPADDTLDEKDTALRTHISYMYAMGYDYCNVIPEFEFEKSMQTSDTTNRSFLTVKDMMIQSRQDFNRYPWPSASGDHYTLIENARGYMPEGMKVIVYSRGPHLAALYLLGYEGICYLLIDDESLVRDVINMAGESIYELYTRCSGYSHVGALGMGEDLAFFSSTYLSHTTLRKYVFPWYKKIVKACHSNNKPVVFHSCGNNETVMEDIIACGFDAKHSFEDKIIPVWESKKKWGDRIAVMGGFDMHKITMFSPDEVKAHTKFLFDECKPGGGWAFGTGNSVADYIPVENFVVMLQTGYELGRF